MRIFQLDNNINIPALGFGTWDLNGQEAMEAVSYALEIGYRHIDTADTYNNHKEIGMVIQKSGIPREEVFITTKVWRDDLGKNALKDAAHRFLDELQVDYLDLLLIHWPNSNFPIKETMQAMRALKEGGIIKAIGVSNFTIKLLEEALLKGKAEIVNNQVEYHPSFKQPVLRKWCEKNDVLLTAYSPLGQGKDMQLPIIREVAKKHGRPSEQVVLNWIMSQGMVAIPKSANKEHIKSNFESTQWPLVDEDVEKISKQAEQRGRLLHPPFAEFEERS